jgi:hypothetical protein
MPAASIMGPSVNKSQMGFYSEGDRLMGGKGIFEHYNRSSQNQDVVRNLLPLYPKTEVRQSIIAIFNGQNQDLLH